MLINLPEKIPEDLREKLTRAQFTHVRNNSKDEAVRNLTDNDVEIIIKRRLDSKEQQELDNVSWQILRNYISNNE